MAATDQMGLAAAAALMEALVVLAVLIPFGQILAILLMAPALVVAAPTGLLAAPEQAGLAHWAKV
jgi:hypothetical protein